MKKKRVAELEDQLGAKTTQLDATIKERDRLLDVEKELQTKTKQLTSEISSLKTAHQSDMQKLVDTRTEVEGSLRLERNAAVKKLEDATKHYQDDLYLVKATTELALASLQKVDSTLASKLLYCFSSGLCFLLLPIC